MYSPSDDLTIRRITAEDGSLLRELRMASLADAPDAFGQTVGQIRIRPSTEWRQSARQAAQGHGRSWYIAESDGLAVGIVQGRRRPPGTLLVFSMWVDDRYRRRGIGRKLIERAEAWASEWDAVETVLWVLQANAKAIDFYRDLGFEVVSAGADADNGARFEALALRRPISRGA